MFKLSEQESEISRVTNKIETLEAISTQFGFNIEILADRHKERGDKYINLYRDTYAVNNLVRFELADNSIRDYESAVRIFKQSGNDLKMIYSIMASGNAFKERFLPTMNLNEFSAIERCARQKYKDCINLCYKNMDKHAQQYHFTMLEQINLTVRGEVWSKKLLPKKVIVLHSLKSPESHICLEGLCYFAYKSNCEIWEYRFGKVKAFDDEKKFIKDRLNEACAVIFLASPKYSPERNIIQFEVDTTIDMKKKSDPVLVWAVDLGNSELVDKLRPIGKIFSKENLESIFIENYREMEDIYSCRRFRCKN